MDDSYQSMLGRLLAIIHRDGGHYQHQHGTPKAVEDAIKIIHSMREVADGKDDCMLA